MSQHIEIAKLSSKMLDSIRTTDGSFAWWYADLIDENGDGLVCIWSIGLPFLTGVRRGGLPHARPSVNLALYRAGRCVLYLLQEHRAEALSDFSETGAARIGRSRIEVDQQERQLKLRVTLDESVSGHASRLRANIELNGIAPLLPSAEGAEHVWTPRLVHAQGNAEVTHDGRVETLSGLGYFDGNASLLPLHAQGIDSWRWARFHVENRSYVVYAVTGRNASTRVLEDQPDGSLREVAATLVFRESRFGSYGVRSPREFELDFGTHRIVCQAEHLVDDGPFYQRLLLRVWRVDSKARDCVDAPVGFGIYEFVQPGRIDLPWQRPFVRMRTHRVGDENSALLPLFSGWEMGRERRWLNTFRQWLVPPNSRPGPLWSDFARNPGADRYHGTATHDSATTLDAIEGKHEFEQES